MQATRKRRLREPRSSKRVSLRRASWFLLAINFLTFGGKYVRYLMLLRHELNNPPPTIQRVVEEWNRRNSSKTFTVEQNKALLTAGLPEAAVLTMLQDFGTMTGCGYFKCWFPSLQSSKLPEQEPTGWLVTRARRYYPRAKRHLPVYNAAYDAWEFALQRQVSHGMRHFYLPHEPPVLTGRLSSYYNTVRLFLTKYNDTICDLRAACRVAPGAPSGLIVQRLRQAPLHATLAKLFVGRDMTNVATNNHVNNNSIPVLTLTPPWEELVNTLSVSRREFVHNLWADLNVTQQLLYDYPDLQVDLQFLITTKGHVYQLDLDRLFDAALQPSQWRHKFELYAQPSLQQLRQQARALL